MPDALDMANLSSVAVQVGLLEDAAHPLSRFDERLRVSLSLDVLGDAEGLAAACGKRAAASTARCARADRFHGRKASGGKPPCDKGVRRRAV